MRSTTTICVVMYISPKVHIPYSSIRLLNSCKEAQFLIKNVLD